MMHEDCDHPLSSVDDGRSPCSRVRKRSEGSVSASATIAAQADISRRACLLWSAQQVAMETGSGSGPLVRACLCRKQMARQSHAGSPVSVCRTSTISTRCGWRWKRSARGIPGNRSARSGASWAIRSKGSSGRMSPMRVFAQVGDSGGGGKRLMILQRCHRVRLARRRAAAVPARRRALARYLGPSKVGRHQHSTGHASCESAHIQLAR